MKVRASRSLPEPQALRSGAASLRNDQSSSRGFDGDVARHYRRRPRLLPTVSRNCSTAHSGVHPAETRRSEQNVHHQANRRRLAHNHLVHARRSRYCFCHSSPHLHATPTRNASRPRQLHARSFEIVARRPIHASRSPRIGQDPSRLSTRASARRSRPSSLYSSNIPTLLSLGNLLIPRLQAERALRNFERASNPASGQSAVDLGVVLKESIVGILSLMNRGLNESTAHRPLQQKEKIIQSLSVVTETVGPAIAGFSPQVRALPFFS